MRKQTVMAERRLASVTIAANYIGVAEVTIRRHIAAGTLTAFRLGPQVLRVDLNEIDRVLLGGPDAA